MPIYEFYCQACHTVFNFFSRSVNTSAQPACPQCNGPLQRQVSMFVMKDKARVNRDADALPLSEQQLAAGLKRMEREVERMKEDDPREAARMLQKFTDATGVRFNEMFEHAISRMADGEDPERIEEDMGDALEQTDPFASGDDRARIRRPPPRHDTTLYEL